jgi:hypothetical protein
MMPVKKIIAANRRTFQGSLEAAYFLTVGGGLLGWWIGGLLGWWGEGSCELLIGLGGGFVLAAIITAIDLHSRKSHPVETQSAPLGDSQSEPKARLEQLQGLKDSGLLSS